MKKSEKRELMKQLDRISRHPLPLSTDKGKVTGRNEALRINSKKDLRRKARIYPRIIKPKMKWKNVLSQALEPAQEYDKWKERKDGFRHFMTDGSRKKNKGFAKFYDNYSFKPHLFPSKVNSKLLKELQIRKAQKSNKKAGLSTGVF